LSDFRSQQQRWTKGSIQTARKILPLILKSHLSIPIKIEAAAHLLANFCWLFGFGAMLTLFPLILCRAGIGMHDILKVDIPVFLFSGGGFLIYYFCFALFTGYRKTIWLLPLLPAFSIGISPALTMAVVAGFFSKGGCFNRTPKFGIKGNSSSEKMIFHLSSDIVPDTLVSIILLLYTFAPIGLALDRETWMAIPFLSIFPFGFLIIVGKNLHEFFLSDYHIKKNQIS
jgi:hypothetical protein